MHCAVCLPHSRPPAAPSLAAVHPQLQLMHPLLSAQQQQLLQHCALLGLPMLLLLLHLQLAGAVCVQRAAAFAQSHQGFPPGQQLAVLMKPHHLHLQQQQQYRVQEADLK